MKLKDSELKSILAEVETEIASLLKSEEQALKKAKDDGDADDKGEASASAPAEASAPAASASAAPAAEASAPVAPPEASASPEASAPAPEASASASPEASAPADASADPAADIVADPQALQAEYAKLDPESLKAHYIACKAALFAVMGAEASASATPPPGPAAPEASSTEATPPPALKAEVPASIKDVPANGDVDDTGKNGGKGALHDVKKSERDAEVEDLKAQVDLLAKAVDMALGAPMRKAVTSTADLAAPAPAKELSKSEIKTKIRKAMEGGKLTKSQRELVFSYTLGNTDFDQIKDLLG